VKTDIGSITITGTIINCNTPVDNNGNILGRYASSQSIIRINTTKLMYVSTTIGYNSVGSNNDTITCSSGTQHKDYLPMGITYTDRIGSERSATLNSSYAYVGSAMNPYIELIGSDKNVINNGVYTRPSSCANGSRSSNANHQQQTGNTDDVISTTGRDNEDGERGSTRIPDVNVFSSTTSTFEGLMNDDTAPTTTNTGGNENYIGAIANDQNRINIGNVSTNIINFEEIRVTAHPELKIDSFEHVLLEKMGSICLVNLRLRRKSHGLWRTTRTYQWKYSWYKLDGRGVTGFCAADRIRIWRYASQLVLVS